MARLALALLLPLLPAQGAGEAQPFVPACIAERCSAEAKALAGDGYAQALGTCVGRSFGPCAPKAWRCLGDPACRSVVSCGPKVFNTCKQDIWKVLTDPQERARIMCLMNCNKNGTIEPLCVALKCGAAAVQCLEDPTCIHAAECVPKAQLACSEAGFGCAFGHSEVCRDNLKCLANGVGSCADPAVNMLTDSRIADFVGCAGSKCPHPENSMPDPSKAGDLAAAAAQLPEPAAGPAAAAEQLVCIAEKCGSTVLQVFEDPDSKALLQCAAEGDLTHLCSSVWQCLGDAKCSEALDCWSAPLQACEEDVWHVLTDATQRQRLQSNAACLQSCKAENEGDFVAGTFCILDKCSADLLACKADAGCWKAVQCLPTAADKCGMSSVDAYVHQPLFKDSVKCLGRGFESCGRRAVEMLRDQRVARAVQCAAQCTRKPGAAGGAARPDLVV